MSSFLTFLEELKQNEETKNIHHYRCWICKERFHAFDEENQIHRTITASQIINHLFYSHFDVLVSNLAEELDEVIDEASSESE